MKLSELKTLVADPDHFSRGLVVEMLRGFDFKEPWIAKDGGEAKNCLTHRPVDILICEAWLGDLAASALLHWLRRSAPPAQRMIPVIVLTGQPRLTVITEARDAGASVVVRKPVSARTLRQHLLWAARSQRAFAHAGRYVGPDRRFVERPVPAFAERRQTAEEIAAMMAGTDANDARIHDHIGALKIIFAVHGHRPVNTELLSSVLTHGEAILARANAGSKSHLSGVAQALCDAATGLSPGDTRGTASLAVHLETLQLLAPGPQALSGAAADQVIGALARMLSHLQVESSLAHPAAAGRA